MLEELIRTMGLLGILLAATVILVLIWGCTELINRMGKKDAPQEIDWKQDYHAKVTGKRTHGRTYYATFQNDAGDREELELAGEAYGLLAEGDTGMLSIVDGHFAGFARDRQET